MARKQSERQAEVWDAMDEIIARAAALNQAVIIACRDGPVAILTPPYERLEGFRVVETVVR